MGYNPIGSIPGFPCPNLFASSQHKPCFWVYKALAEPLPSHKSAHGFMAGKAMWSPHSFTRTSCETLHRDPQMTWTSKTWSDIWKVIENIKHLSHELYPVSLILQLRIALCSCHSICNLKWCITSDSPPHLRGRGWCKNNHLEKP